MVEQNSCIFLATALFFMGIFGVLVRRNVFFVLMSVELMLNAANLLFVAFAKSHGDLDGHVYAFLVMAVAAAEACVGLAIVISFFRRAGSIDVSDAAEMRR